MSALDPWRIPIDRATALRLICPLPDGAVAGVQQVARRGDFVITAVLTQTIRHDTWDGIRIGVGSPGGGEVAANWFGLAEHQVFGKAGRLREAGHHELDRVNQARLLQYDRIRAGRLRDAVDVYTAAVASPAPPEFAASARLGALDGLARRLDHVGSTYPHVLAGRSFIHAEMLREVHSELHHDLLPLTGERQAADNAPLGLTNGLAAMRKLAESLLELADSADYAEHPAGARFREQAQALAAIDEQITADYARSLGSATGDRATAARRRSLMIAAEGTPDGPVAEAAPPTGLQARAVGRPVR
ncbi:hypothetical protein [Kitasatospora aureofaciens]|uniref:hypothetical protein n=1 Tax=Kitasatospora aureofaciens TaxID=1894 RepID=UPI0033C5EBFA